MKFNLLLFILSAPSLLLAQVIDFENVKDREPGQAIGYVTVGDNPCQVRFFIGHNLTDTIHLTLQEVGLRVENEDYLTGGFQGIINSRDCSENIIPQNRMNQINYKPFELNPSMTNRERVGCRFVSTALRGNDLPSVFVHFSIPTSGCSGDILDLDGANDAIEAYEIYYYQTVDDFPNHPLSENPIEIRTKGKSFGSGEIGEDGGVTHFSIYNAQTFALIEIRPNQQVTPKNKLRDVFGFALDNFSPFEVEKAPYTPPYVDGSSPLITVNKKKMEVEQTLPIEENPTFESIYFDYDRFGISGDAKKELDQITAFLKLNPTKRIELIGYTDKKGDEDYNLKLSQKRVLEVQKYLIEKGVLQSQISTNYKGESQANTNSDPDWKNRKVSVVIL